MRRILTQPKAALLASAGVALAAAAAVTATSSQTTAPHDAASRGEVPPSLEHRAGVTTERPAGAEGAAATPAARSLAPPSGAPGCAFEGSSQASYALSSRDRAEVDPTGFGLGSGGARRVEVESAFEGRLDTLVLSNSEDGALVLAKLSRFRSTSIREDEKVELPFLFRVAGDCSIQGFAHDARLGAGYARIQQAVVHDLSFSAATRAATSFEGRDSLGQTSGTMREEDRGAGRVLIKELDALEPWKKGIASIRDVDSYTATITPSRTGWFETFEMNARYSGVGITSERTLSARRVEDLVDLEGASREDSDYVWTDLLPTLTPLEEARPASPSELAAQAKLRDHDVSDVLGRLVDRVDTQGVGIQDTWPELQVYLEARPEMARVVADLLVTDQIPSQATMAAFIALGNTRTLEAKTSLLEIARNGSFTSFDRVRAIFSLVDRPDVGDEFAHELAALAAPLAARENVGRHLVARHALLALGMFSGLNPQRDDIKQVAVGAIRKALSEGADSGLASPAYGAFANIGDHELLPMIADVIDHPDYSTREVAALATRRMDPSEAAAFTRRWLEKEKDWRVKLTLYHNLELQTFEAREMTSREVLELALADLSQGPGVITRKALVRLLGRAMRDMDTSDPLRQRIERVFTSMVRFEIDNRTGLYRPLTEHLDPALIREGITGYRPGPPAAPAPFTRDDIQMRAAP